MQEEEREEKEFLFLTLRLRENNARLRELQSSSFFEGLFLCLRTSMYQFKLKSSF